MLEIWSQGLLGVDAALSQQMIEISQVGSNPTGTAKYFAVELCSRINIVYEDKHVGVTKHTTLK
jgi:hypothetical protein